MRVGIITFQRVNNYGAILQAYALQKVIKSFGVECETIDYQRDNIGDSIKWLKNKIKGYLKLKPDKQLYTFFEFFKVVVLEIFLNQLAAKKFNEFRNNITLSKKYNKSDITETNSIYDLFISGSDQVWNCGRVNLDSTYMLDFVDNPDKKCSYGASFGISSIPEKYYNDYREILKDYKYLSVREAEGIDILRALIGREARLVLDPTLLLDSADWENVISHSEIDNAEPYILLYQLGTSPSLISFTKKLAEKTNYKVFAIPHSIGSNINSKWCIGKGPVEWLSLIKNAEYIVTNSFHGAAFSINFNKRFFVDVSSRPTMKSRIDNILTLTGLQDRLIVDGENDHITKEIDYQQVNKRLEDYRDISLGYLKEMLGIIG